MKIPHLSCTDEYRQKIKFTNNGLLYSFFVNGATRGRLFPSTRLALKPPVLSEKNITWRRFSYLCSKSAEIFFVGLFKWERSEISMQYVNKHRIYDTVSKQENPENLSFHNNHLFFIFEKSGRKLIYRRKFVLFAYLSFIYIKWNLNLIIPFQNT